MALVSFRIAENVKESGQRPVDLNATQFHCNTIAQIDCLHHAGVVQDPHVLRQGGSTDGNVQRRARVELSSGGAQERRDDLSPDRIRQGLQHSVQSDNRVVVGSCPTRSRLTHLSFHHPAGS
jgi:hypothetical protein